MDSLPRVAQESCRSAASGFLLRQHSAQPLIGFLAQSKSNGLRVYAVPTDGLNYIGRLGCARIINNLDDMGVVGVMACSGHGLAIQNRIFDCLKGRLTKGFFYVDKKINGFHFVLLEKPNTRPSASLGKSITPRNAGCSVSRISTLLIDERTKPISY
jgi:hypothetical protein